MDSAYWVTLWTRSYETRDQGILAFSSASLYPAQHVVPPHNRSITYLPKDGTSSNLWYYLGIYVAISVVAGCIGTIKYFFCFLAGIRASKQLFQNLTYTVLRAQLRWLDTVPVGRILNRFTADFNVSALKVLMLLN